MGAAQAVLRARFFWSYHPGVTYILMDGWMDGKRDQLYIIHGCSVTGGPCLAGAEESIVVVDAEGHRT